MTPFGLIEQDPAAARIREAATRNTLSHALLFTAAAARRPWLAMRRRRWSAPGRVRGHAGRAPAAARCLPISIRM